MKHLATSAASALLAFAFVVSPMDAATQLGKSSHTNPDRDVLDVTAQLGKSSHTNPDRDVLDVTAQLGKSSHTNPDRDVLD